MSSKVESTKSDDEDISCGLLLRDIEEISRALYLHKSPHDAFNSTGRSMASKSGISEYDVTVRDSLHKGKKSSIWNWKPIKSLTHTRNHRFNCCFSLHVHAIEGLPSYFNNLSLCVVWKQKAVMLRTRPTQVCLGMAEFEETLMHRCTIFVDRTGIHSSVKYEPQLCLLHASVIGSPTLDIGSQVIDLTRFLPLTLEELVGDKSSSGKWTTSFKLSGKAKGAVLNVSFGFSIYGGSVELDYFAKVPDNAKEGRMHHFADSDISRTNQLHKHGRVPKMLLGGSYQPTKSANLNLFDELLLKQPVELSQSVALLYQKLDKKKMGYPLEFDLYHLSHESGTVGGQAGHEFDNADFDVIEQGIEVLEKDQITPEKCSSQRFESSVIETIDVADIFGGEETDFVEYVEWKSKLDADNHDEYECGTDDPEHRDTNIACITEPAFEEVDSDLDSLLDRITYNEPGNHMRSESINRSQRLRRSLSLDDLGLAESIENDFLNMLSIDQDQENMIPGSDHGTSTDLLRLFEEDPLSWEDSILDSDLIAETEESCSFTPTGNEKVALVATPAIDLSFPIQAVESSHQNQSIRNKRNAEMLETLETEALMHEWGLSEKAFQYSPCVIPGGFGSPVYLPTEEPLQLPPIVEGKGPIVRTKNGGILRSMNPLLFRNANNGARLIVQVSAPVVFPLAMGSMATEVLRCWACAGFEKMCFQANELMPLEDVTGKTIQQVLAEAESGSDASNRWDVHQESDCSNMDQIGSDYVPIEDLVPMVIANIESLLVEGLKIQSGMPDQAPPSSIRIQLAENSTSSRNASETSSNFGSERASGFPILDADELIKCSLSLEEWLRLDSGKLNLEDDNNENISKLSAAHCGKPMKSSSEWLSDRSGVEVGDDFRMGLKVQLRDPMRDYEMVGAPMLALAQVNRVYKRMTVEGDDLEPMFSVSEAHLAGFNIAQHGNTPFWGTSRQRQSGSRWLLSSGMARSKKNLVSNSNVVVRSSSGLLKKAQNEDVLWSISLPVEGEAAAWDERIALNVHVRNADIVFPLESV